LRLRKGSDILRLCVFQQELWKKIEERPSVVSNVKYFQQSTLSILSEIKSLRLRKGSDILRLCVSQQEFWKKSKQLQSATTILILNSDHLIADVI